MLTRARPLVGLVAGLAAVVLAGASDYVRPWLAALPPVQAAAAQSRVRAESRSISDRLAAALQQLAKVQRRYYTRHWKYARTLDDLWLRRDGDIVLQITSVTANGWAAVAIHRTYPTRSCVYYEGTVSRPPRTAAGRRPGVERAVVCDSF